jgi:hypothetical protein
VADYHIHWVRATVAEFSTFLKAAHESIEIGNASLARAMRSRADRRENVVLVSEHLAAARDRPSLYLRGAEPEWSDLVYGRAAQREADDELFEQASALLRDGRREDAATSILVVAGTAGTGKSTAIMRLAMRLSSEGSDVGWVDGETEVSSQTLGRYMHEADAPPVLMIDDAERYGNALPRFLREAYRSDRVGLVVLGMRESRTALLESPVLSDVNTHAFTVPMLGDSDIGRLIDLLDREKRLVTLHALSRAEQEHAFAQQAGRQLLVAMMQATHDRPFEEKVHGEWSELTATQRYFYALIGLASVDGMPLDRAALLLAKGSSDSDDWRRSVS